MAARRAPGSRRGSASTMVDALTKPWPGGRRWRHPGRQRRGHDAALGRRYRVAHMPTASTTAPGDLRGVIKSESEPAAFPIKNDRPVVPPTGSTSPRHGPSSYCKPGPSQINPTTCPGRGAHSIHTRALSPLQLTLIALLHRSNSYSKGSQQFQWTRRDDRGTLRAKAGLRGLEKGCLQV